MNVRLLRRIQKQILKEPGQFQMWAFYTKHDHVIHKIPNCGTAACIAGWAVALVKKATPEKANKFRISVWSKAGRDIGLTSEEQRERLFYNDSWPLKFKDAFNRCNSPKQRAKIAASRIDHFIKTGGKE